ncbi:hypothetical protein OO013_16860 [Mangrovivirga sp. M17]|uniref:Lipoprotein n=1 Tax=Mangrovivirga halotolerans TaxID=2993936 RepID=A0ABT3RW23_9BACT|nr:hypothetical protein [Mangrovivirga halotolerans]MCX2745554.1 hypothetical protein [Mangrovivirga halotolerans]
MKYYYPILIIFLFISCNDDDDTINRGERVVIPIVEMTVPESAKAYTEISINIKAVAPNGCHSDLVIEADLVEENSILFTATAFKTASEVCPDVLVPKDSTFKFTVGANSEFGFQANEEPFDILRDTTYIVE